MHDSRKPTDYDIPHFCRIEYLKYGFEDRHRAILANTDEYSSLLTGFSLAQARRAAWCGEEVEYGTPKTWT